MSIGGVLKRVSDQWQSVIGSPQGQQPKSPQGYNPVSSAAPFSGGGLGGQSPFSGGGGGYQRTSSPQPFTGAGVYQARPSTGAWTGVGGSPSFGGSFGGGSPFSPFNASQFMIGDLAPTGGMTAGGNPVTDATNFGTLNGDATGARGIEGTKQWDGMIDKAAGEAGIPREVIAAIMGIESGGDPGSTSVAGAAGLMQVMSHYQSGEVLWQPLIDKYGGDKYDPYTNIRVGAEILKTFYNQYGSWDKAAAAYLGAINADGTINDDSDAYGTTGHTYVQLFANNLAALGYTSQSYGEISAEGAPAFPEYETVIDFALNASGTPYIWGGESYEEGGFDCSGLMQAAYAQAGIQLARTAQEQYDTTERITSEQVQPGDLVYFHTADYDYVTHVGMYIGNGQMIHAPKEGDIVRTVNINDEFWQSVLVGYGRVGSGSSSGPTSSTGPTAAPGKNWWEW